MSKTPIFKKERNLYWSSEFTDVVNILTGVGEDGNSSQNKMFSTNAHVMVLAASIGVHAGGGVREVSSSQRKEISTQVFFSQGLDAYLLLVPMMGEPEKGQDLIRPENDELLLRLFEGYAGRGFEILSRIFNDSPGKSPEILLQFELLKLVPSIPGSSEITGEQGIQDIFS
jgi:hypothetical protein